MLRSRLHLVCWFLFAINIFALFWRFRALKRDQSAICRDVVSTISPDLRVWVDGINARLDYLYRKTTTNDYPVSSVTPTFSESSVDWAFGVDNGAPLLNYLMVCICMLGTKLNMVAFSRSIGALFDVSVGFYPRSSAFR